MAGFARVALLLVCCLASLPLLASPTRNNDDSCDVAVFPAATLLLPYFEVSQDGNLTTLFSITNASPEEQIAHVTLWTDYSYPVIDFNIYLTGYDVQPINLHDIIMRGIIAPDLGTGTDISDVGDFSIDNEKLDLTACDELPGQIPNVYVLRMMNAFMLGKVGALGSIPACNTVGGTHPNAVGYATIDVVRSCTTRNPTMAGYLTEDILWDNVLMGDYHQLDRRRNFSESDTMVHIRAVPEGGSASERRNYPNEYAVEFHRTFYSRFQTGSNTTFDGRQPLPALFAARWILGSSAEFQTSYKIWREGVTPPTAPCNAYPNNDAQLTEIVIFDEEENPEAVSEFEGIPTPLTMIYRLPGTSLTAVNNGYIFPVPTAGAIAGWVYFNLDNDAAGQFASQNWIVTSMRSEGRWSADTPAYVLGNGCTPPLGRTEVTIANGPAIAPPGNINP